MKRAFAGLAGLLFTIAAARALATPAPVDKDTLGPKVSPPGGLTPKASPATPGKPISVATKIVQFEQGSETWTEVSGYSGTGNSQRGGVIVSNYNFAPYNIRMGEKTDDPRAIYFQIKRLDANSTTEEGALVLPNYGWGTDKGIEFTGHRFIRGVAICTGDEKDTDDRKLKGMKLYYATVTSDGVVTDDDRTGSKWERTHCDIWHPARYCAHDKVARAFRMHANSSNKWYHGMALECMKPVMK